MSEQSIPTTKPAASVTVNQPAWPRYVGWVGLVEVVVIVTVVVIEIAADFPSFTDPPAEIRNWFASDRADLVVAVVAAGDLVTDLLLFLPFVLGVAYVLEHVAADDPVLTRLSLLGGVMSVPLLWMSHMFPVALYVGGHDGLSDPSLVALLASGNYVFGSLTTMSLGLWLGAGGLAILRSHRFPRAAGWIGVGGSIALIISGLWFLDGDPEGPLAAAGLVGFLAMLVWMVTVAVSLIRHGLGTPGPGHTTG